MPIETPVIPRIPIVILGENGVSVSTLGGVLTLSLDLSTAPAMPASLPGGVIPIFDDASGTVFAWPLSTLLALVAAAAAGSGGASSSTDPIATIVAAEAVVPGLPVFVDQGTGKLRAARADTKSSAFVEGLAATAGIAGNAVQMLSDRVALADWTAATGAKDLVAGAVYYLAAAGGLVLQAGAPIGVAGCSIVTVGRAVDARTLFVAPSNPILQ